MHAYPNLPEAARRPVATWLFVMAGLVGAMTVIGGVTRLTESGLSMVEWRPLIGWLPPMSTEEWSRVFALYRQTPEYQLINAGMSLADFQTIFWWEFVHRVWGRLLGVAFAVPLAFFWLKGWAPAPLRGRLLLLLGLGGLQGAIGWWMVRSGLVDEPDVSHYRLAVHLGMAFLIAGLLTWTALSVACAKDAPAPAYLRRRAWAALVVVGFVVILGAFVAGMNAGMIFNTFPLIEGKLAPAELLALDPIWLNPFENLMTIQFNHRWGAILAAVLVLALWFASMHAPLSAGQRRAVCWFGGLVIAQVLLGIATLLSVVWTPLAALHQAMALSLFLVGVWTVWRFAGARGRA